MKVPLERAWIYAIQLSLQISNCNLVRKNLNIANICKNSAILHEIDGVFNFGDTSMDFHEICIFFYLSPDLRECHEYSDDVSSFSK